MAPSSPAGEVRSHRSEYIKAGIALLILMVLKVAVVVIPMSRQLMIGILMLLMAAKIYIITAYFMHLKFEAKGLVILALIPATFAILLLIGAAPDFIPL